MPVSESKKRSNAKWNAKNMVTLSCGLRKNQADKYKAYCAEKGIAPNTDLKNHVMFCIEEYELYHPEAKETDQEELD